MLFFFLFVTSLAWSISNDSLKKGEKKCFTDIEFDSLVVEKIKAIERDTLLSAEECIDLVKMYNTFNAGGGVSKTISQGFWKLYYQQEKKILKKLNFKETTVRSFYSSDYDLILGRSHIYVDDAKRDRDYIPVKGITCK